MAEQSLTYSGAGVDITAGNQAVELMKPLVKSTFRSEVVTDLGGFGGLFALNKDKYEEPILISGTDGVGTKLKIAFEMNKHNTIGIDAVAMCVNDVLVNGAEPLFFLDYLAVGKCEPEQVAEIVSGIAEGCRQAGCALIGGETAEMPGFYPVGEYDVAGFTVGIVDKKKIIDGSKICSGDVLLGLPSTGVHSNGFSLARKVLLEHAGLKMDDEIEALGGAKLGDVILTPTKIYVKTILDLIEKAEIKGMAHITGGGLLENIPRVLPENCQVQIDSTTWPILPIFQLIQEKGNVEKREMFRTFNMGIGFVMICDAENAEKVKAACAAIDQPVYQIGAIVEGEKKVVIDQTCEL